MAKHSVKIRNIEHTQTSPFPYDWKKAKAPTATIIDEDCACGHRRSDHFDTLAFGHGNCSICGDCQKFTWTAFVQGQPARPPPRPRRNERR